MNFDTIIYHQQAPFSGVVAGEQAIQIQSSIAYFSVFLLIFLLHLLSLIILKKKKNQSNLVLINPNFSFRFLFLLTLTGDGWLRLQETQIFFVDDPGKLHRQRRHATQGKR
jgi:hypothetical protein